VLVREVPLVRTRSHSLPLIVNSLNRLFTVAGEITRANIYNTHNVNECKTVKEARDEDAVRMISVTDFYGFYIFS
jgi:hypothetical protein